jgi:uncharacterized protein with ParB-like and HNH nuclease domain
MPRFRDIPQISRANYSVHVSWRDLEESLSKFGDINRVVDLNPDYQRGHVWTSQQQTEYIEHVLRGGSGGENIYWNCPGWMDDFRGPFELVDGKQRIWAVLLFKKDKVKAYGHYFSEYTDKLDYLRHRFEFHVNNLSNRTDVIKWYLALNSGTPHSRDDIKKAQQLLKEISK